VPFFKGAAPEMVSGMSGESEEKVRSLFEEAKAAAPSIIFIDEIDAITSKRESTSRGMEKRIVAQLLTSMDSLAFNNWSGPKSAANDDGETDGGDEETPQVHKAVIVIGATNYPDALDPALRRAGRFDREIAVGIPDQKARERILLTLTGKMKLEGSFDLIKIARLTPGYVGADLSALAKEAAVIAINRIFGGASKLDAAPTDRSTQDEDSDDGYGAAFSDSLAPESMDGANDDVDMDTSTEDAPSQVVSGGGTGHDGTGHRKSAAEALGSRDQLTVDQMAPLFITMADFEEATAKVQPSSKREGFATVPSVSWDDIGAMGEVSDFFFNTLWDFFSVLLYLL
jgi:ribosome biogenesis ATPase